MVSDGVGWSGETETYAKAQVIAIRNKLQNILKTNLSEPASPTSGSLHASAAAIRWASSYTSLFDAARMCQKVSKFEEYTL